MKCWKRWIVMASVIVTAGTSYGQSPLFDVRSSVPNHVEVVQLSTSPIVKLMKEKDSLQMQQLASKQNPTELDKTYLQYYEMAKTSPDLLGNMVDLYQLQGDDQYGANTALVGTFRIPKESVNSLLPIPYPSKGFTKEELGGLLFVMNGIVPSLDVSMRGYQTITIPNRNHMIQVELGEVDPLEVTTMAGQGAITAAGQVTLDVNGFALPYYVRAALVGSPEEPTGVLMVTSDVEKSYFKPIFTQMTHQS